MLLKQDSHQAESRRVSVCEPSLLQSQKRALLEDATGYKKVILLQTPQHVHYTSLWLVRTLVEAKAKLVFRMQVTRGVMYTKQEAEGKRLKNPFDTITEGIGINRQTVNFSLAHIDGAFQGTDREAVEMVRCTDCLQPWPLYPLPLYCVTSRGCGIGVIARCNVSDKCGQCLLSRSQIRHVKQETYLCWHLIVHVPFRAVVFFSFTPDTWAQHVHVCLQAAYLLRNDGLFVGSSAAMNCVGAVKLARKLGPGHTIATILCDGGQRYSPCMTMACSMLC